MKKIKKVTPKEKEVLELLAEGMSSKQIAERMEISFHTVESHRKSLREKFCARNAMEIIKKTYRITPKKKAYRIIPVQPPMQTVPLQTGSI